MYSNVACYIYLIKNIFGFLCSFKTEHILDTTNSICTRKSSPCQCVLPYCLHIFHVFFPIFLLLGSASSPVSGAYHHCRPGDTAHSDVSPPWPDLLSPERMKCIRMFTLATIVQAYESDSSIFILRYL